MCTRPMGLSRYPLQSGKRVWRDALALARLCLERLVDVEINDLAARRHDVAHDAAAQVQRVDEQFLAERRHLLGFLAVAEDDTQLLLAVAEFLAAHGIDVEHLAAG